jgi:hypothetical protein
MKNRQWGIFTVGLLAVIGLTNEAQALPMFGKQTGLDCKACHLQHIPKLNAVGRKFAASGMTQSIKEADENSSGMDLNPSVMFKSIYEKTWDLPTSSGKIKETPTSNGDLAVPKTASLFVGGRVSEKVGAIVNLSYKDNEDNSIGGKVVYANKIENGYWGMAVYSSDNFGPFSGMENYNSSLYKPLKTFDMRKLSNAFQATKLGSGSATGVQLYYDKDNLFRGGDHVFGSLGMYAPAQDNRYMDLSSNILPFARVAYEYPVGDFNLILGAFGIVGGSTVSSTEPMRLNRETYGMDFQVEGMMFEKSVSLIMSNVFHNKLTYTGVGSEVEEFDDVFNDAFSVEGEVNLTPDFGVKAAYMTMNDRYTYPHESKYVNIKDIDRAITIGFDYSFALYLPMKLSVEHAWAKPYLDQVKDYRDLMVTLNVLY